MNLEEARVQAGLTQTQLAEMSRVNRATLARAEKQDKNDPISRAYAHRIVNALNEYARTSYTVEALGIITGR